MKKTYQAPCVEVNEIGATQMICESIDGFNKALGTTEKSGNAALGRDRGDYEPAEDADNFGDLW